MDTKIIKLMLLQQLSIFFNSWSYDVSTTRATLLIMFCPADSREQYFEGLAELTKDGRQPSSEELLELMQRFDQFPAPV